MLATKNQKLAFAVSLALIYHHKKKKKTRSKYVRDILLGRRQFGEFRLVREMEEDPEYHFRYFRMSKENFQRVLSFVGPRIVHSPNHLIPISPEERLSITLRYLAGGSSQVSMGFNYRVSPCTIGKILRETLAAIWDTMAPEFVPPPTLATYKSSADEYYKKWNFPHCVGSIDGKHVKIIAPGKSGSDFFNYKGFFSIVLLAIADANYKFAYVDIGAKGSQSDSGIFSNSTFGQKLYTGSLDLPEEQLLPNSDKKAPFVFIGDEAFPLKRNLMRPYPGKKLTTEQRVFNYRLCQARRIVENTFGIWAARFRIFFTTINADLDLADLIVKATVVLHNFLTTNSDFGRELTFDRDVNGTLTEGSWRSMTSEYRGIADIPRTASNNRSNSAAKVREEFKNFFNSEAGSVDWQYDAVHFFEDSC